MEKRYLSPIELLTIATQHIYAADFLMQEIAKSNSREEQMIETFTPLTSLIYTAFQLIFKAYCMHEHRPVKEYKKLMELVELNSHLGLSSKELSLLKNLSRQQVFNKGTSYDLWDNQQQAHVFCAELIALYERIQKMMPLELHPDYLS